jgi:hypothetical protein
LSHPFRLTLLEGKLATNFMAGTGLVSFVIRMICSAFVCEEEGDVQTNSHIHALLAGHTDTELFNRKTLKSEK